MNVINYRVSLDMFDTLSQATIKAKKGDSACRIHIALTEYGKIYKISEGCYATLSAKKSDGTFIYDNCKIEGNDIYYDFSSSIKDGVTQITACEGIVECEVALFKGDSERLTSPRFTLVVDGTVYNGEEIVSSDEADALKSLIQVAHGFVEMAEDSAQSASVSATTATESADIATEAAASASFSAEASSAYMDSAANFSAAAEAAAKRAEAAGGGSVIEWELLETQTLEASTTEAKLKLSNIKNYRGARVKVIIPSGTTLASGVPNVKATLPSSRSLLTRINYVNSFTTSAPTVFYFDVLPKGDVWSFDVFPYSGMLGTTTGDIRVDIVDGKVDRIEYMVVSGSSSNQLPAGTVIEYWGVK